MTAEEFTRAQSLADSILKSAQAEGDPSTASVLLDRWLDIQRKLEEGAPKPRPEVQAFVDLSAVGWEMVSKARALLQEPDFGLTQQAALVDVVEEFARRQVHDENWARGRRGFVYLTEAPRTIHATGVLNG
jgi:hypothetical protein